MTLDDTERDRRALTRAQHAVIHWAVGQGILPHDRPYIYDKPPTEEELRKVAVRVADWQLLTVPNIGPHALRAFRAAYGYGDALRPEDV